MSTTAPTTPLQTTRKVAARPGLLRYSATHLLVLLIVLLITIPLAEHWRYGLLIEAVLLTVVLISAVLVVGGRKGTLALAILLVAPALIAKWADLLHPGPFSRQIAVAAAAVFVMFIVVQLLTFVLRARRVNSEVLSAGICAYLLLGLFFAFADALVSSIAPGSFARSPPSDRPLMGFEVIYFSFVTLSTVGYGDIVPVSNVARMLAMLEAMTGMLYISVLIARLVSLYSGHSSASGPEHT